MLRSEMTGDEDEFELCHAMRRWGAGVFRVKSLLALPMWSIAKLKLLVVKLVLLLAKIFRSVSVGEIRTLLSISPCAISLASLTEGCEPSGSCGLNLPSIVIWVASSNFLPL